MKPVGNVCTENVVYALEKAGFKTGVDLKKLKEVGDWVCKLLERPNLSVLWFYFKLALKLIKF